MARNLTLMLSLIVACSSLDARACSFAPGYLPFDLNSTGLPNTGPTPTTPALSLHGIERGTDDGYFASCSDAGTLTISIDDPEAAKNLGFLFELESGSIPDKVFPDKAISPIELPDGSLVFRFVWLDLPAGRSDVEPIEAKISVRAVSPTMVEGPKVYLDIRNP